MTIEEKRERSSCDVCGAPAVGFVRPAIEQIPSSLEEQYAGVRRFEPGEKSFYCQECFPK